MTSSEMVVQRAVTRELAAPGGGIVYVNEARETVLVLHANGMWGFPSGVAEAGESTYQCAVREFTEECGLTPIEPLSAIPTRYHAELPTRHGARWFFVDTWVALEAAGHLKSSGEGVAVFVDEARLPDLLLRPNHLEILRAGFEIADRLRSS